MPARLSFENLRNTRDLGGMTGADGRSVRYGRLLRSGHLYTASKNDCTRLCDTAGLIIDLRTENEIAEHPDPVLPGVEICFLPVFESLAAGVSRDAASDEDAFDMVAKDPLAAKNYMTDLYVSFAESAFSLSQYARFVRLLLKHHEKAVLWHCTAGKDRVGFASVIVEELLGVSRDGIMADYLITNDYLKDDIQGLIDLYARKHSNPLNSETRQALVWLFGAHREYLTALYDRITERFGGFDGFLRNGLGITLQEQTQFREIYLA